MQALLTLCFAVLLLVIQPPTHAQPSRPNIVVIVTDDQNADTIAYMPILQERLVDEGMSFTNAYTVTPLCCPSRASILTGQYVHNHGIVFNDGDYGGFERAYDTGLEASTVATWLNEAGYHTALVGKYLNGYPQPDNPNYVPPGWSEWHAQKTPTGDDDYYYGYTLIEDGESVQYGADEADYMTDVLADRAVDVMSRIYKTAPVLITYDHVYSDDQWATVDAAPSGMVENFYGYIRRYERISTTPSGVDTYHVLIESPMLYFANLPIAAQTIIAKPSGEVDNWNKVVDTLAHVAYFAYYLLRYHGGALLSLSDFYIGDLDEFFRGALSVPATNMLNAAQKAVGLCTGANIGCTSDGSVYLRRHGSMESATWRNALTNVWTWQASDIVGELAYDYNPLMEVSETEGAGTVSSTDVPAVSVRARAGLFAGMQGLGVPTMEGFIGADSDDIRDRVGHQHQRNNAPTKQITFAARGGHDLVEPALMEWHILDLDDYDPGDKGVVDNVRALPLQVTRNWQYTPRGIRLTQSVAFEPETTGKRAPIVPQITIGQPIVENPNLCPVSAILWTDNDPTPSGWAALTTGDTCDYHAGDCQLDRPINGARDVTEGYWLSAAAVATVNRAIGVQYTFPSACTLTRASYTWGSLVATGNSGEGGIYVRVGGVWQQYAYFSGSANSGTVTGSGTVTNVTDILFLHFKGNTRAYITRTTINTL